MDAFGFGIDMVPSAALLASDFAELGIQLKSYNEPLKRCIQQVLAPSFLKNFNSGGRPPWPPDTDNTMAHKDYNELMIRTGRLRRVAQQLNIWSIDGPGGTAQVNTIPEPASYGVFHQVGAGFNPERPFLLFQEPEDEDGCVNVFDTWAGERLAAHGF
jgi:phage gpG-like protein